MEHFAAYKCVPCFNETGKVVPKADHACPLKVCVSSDEKRGRVCTFLGWQRKSTKIVKAHVRELAKLEMHSSSSFNSRSPTFMSDIIDSLKVVIDVLALPKHAGDQRVALERALEKCGVHSIVALHYQYGCQHSSCACLSRMKFTVLYNSIRILAKCCGICHLPLKKILGKSVHLCHLAGEVKCFNPSHMGGRNINVIITEFKKTVPGHDTCNPNSSLGAANVAVY